MAVVNYLENVELYDKNISDFVSDTGRVMKPFYRVSYFGSLGYYWEKAFSQEEDAKAFAASLGEDLCGMDRVVPAPYHKGYAYKEF